MSRVLAVVEGQTEQSFVENVLAPALVGRGIYMSAPLVGRPGRKGGVGDYHRARRDILNLLKQEAGTTVTTMFDFYGMPDSWPGRKLARAAVFAEKAIRVEEAIQRDVARALGASFDARRFIPYVQMHEFESLLFVDPASLCGVLRCPHLEWRLQAVRELFGSPEEINDGPDTAPSKRLLALLPEYNKRLHGTIAAIRIGIETMRAACPHFASWIAALESRSG